MGCFCARSSQMMRSHQDWTWLDMIALKTATVPLSSFTSLCGCYLATKPESSSWSQSIVNPDARSASMLWSCWTKRMKGPAMTEMQSAWPGERVWSISQLSFLLCDGEPSAEWAQLAKIAGPSQQMFSSDCWRLQWSQLLETFISGTCTGCTVFPHSSPMCVAFVVFLSDHYWCRSAQEKEGAEADCHFSTYLKAATSLKYWFLDRDVKTHETESHLQTDRCAPFWRVAQSAVLKATLDAEKFSSQPFMSIEGQNATRSAANVFVFSVCEESYL